jgi:hypothetical protein
VCVRVSVCMSVCVCVCVHVDTYHTAVANGTKDAFLPALGPCSTLSASEIHITRNNSTTTHSTEEKRSVAPEVKEKRKARKNRKKRER